MDLNKVNEIWNEFSKSQNIELKYKERKIANTIQSHYLINYTNKIATYSFIGILSRSDNGHNTDKTSIIVEFENRLDIDNFEFIITDNDNNITSDNRKIEFEKNILKKSIEKFKGNSITLKDNFIKIDTDHIFSNIDEFESVIELISEIKSTNN